MFAGNNSKSAYLARQGLAIRRHKEIQGNFQQLLKEHCRNVPELQVWLQRCNDMTSWSIQHEILQIFACTVGPN